MAHQFGKPRRRAQSDAGPSAQFFRQLAESSPHMLWSARPDGSDDYFNARLLEYTGLSQRQLEGWGWRSMVHPDDLERCLARWTAAFKRGMPYEVEYRLRRHDGKYLWHLGAAMPYREGGRIVRWFGSCTEIESQKRAERLLDKARATISAVLRVRSSSRQAREIEHDQIRALMDNMPGVAWIKDSSLRYVWTSSSYERVLGKSLEAVQGRDDFAVWPAEKAEHFRSSDEKVLRVNGAVKDVAHTVLPDGSTVRWMAIKFPLADETGALGVAGIAFDVTESSDEDAPDAVNDLRLARLSGRELQVLHLQVEGYTSAEIGARLTLSPKSVDTYRSRLMSKLGLEDVPSLVKFALRYGLTTKR
jgi:PAS domain S-box-containing protein